MPLVSRRTPRFVFSSLLSLVLGIHSEMPNRLAQLTILLQRYFPSSPLDQRKERERKKTKYSRTPVHAKGGSYRDNAGFRTCPHPNTRPPLLAKQESASGTRLKSDS